MQKNKYKVILFFILMIGCCLNGHTQNEISSPYSKYGYGLPSYITSGAYDAMGKVGYAMQNPYLINFKNPASYVAFDSLSFIADASFSIYSSTLKTTDITQKSTYARPAYLTIGLPVTKHWRTSAGILPFSNLGYSILDSHTSTGETGNYSFSYDGDGNLMQLYWGNAFKICKGLSIGLNASYLFGKMTYTKSAIYEGTNFFNAMINNTTQVDGIYLSGGVQYFVSIKDKHRIGLGVVYENSAYIWTKSTRFIYNYTLSGTTETLSDTVINTTDKGNMRIPQTVGGGISYQYKDKLWITGDVAWHNASRYTMNGVTSENLQDAIIVSAGLQFVPNANSTNYLNKIRFRAGFHYTTGQIVVNSQVIRDFNISIGLGFPLKLFNNNSSLGFHFEYGQMGTLKNNLLKENYFRFSLHFTLQERWYQRGKLN